MTASTGDRRGLDQARALDRAYFAAHPKAKSYVRPLIEGECLLYPDPPKGTRVAVAFVSERQTTKALILHGEKEGPARRDAERLAFLLRGQTERGAAA